MDVKRSPSSSASVRPFFQPLSPEMSSTFLDVYLLDEVINIQRRSERNTAGKCLNFSVNVLELNEYELTVM